MVAAGLLVLAAMAPVDTPREEEAKKELAKLQGVWKLTARESRGRPMTTPTPDRYTLVISGDNCVYYLYGGTIKIDPAKQPHTFDLAIKEGRYAGHTMLGVYELNGTTLKLAMPSSAARADLRPAGVKSDDVAHSLYTFERDAKATKEAVVAELKQRKTALAVGPQPAAVPVVQPAPDVLQKILERLDKIEQRLDGLEKKSRLRRRSSNQYD